MKILYLYQPGDPELPPLLWMILGVAPGDFRGFLTLPICLFEVALRDEMVRTPGQ